jgi:predicted nucleotidyltransferase
MASLEKAILATLVYYDVLDRPLTGWEIFRYLVKIRQEQNSSVSSQNNKISLSDILNILENSPSLTELIDQKNGFYFLKNRSEIVKERIERQKIADQKWKKAKRVIRLLQIIPFIRLVAISGSLAMNNTKKESDIDLLIITQAGRIWTCRGLTTLFIHLIGQRRHGSLTKDRFCLNHYLTNQSLKIPFKSLYNAQTYAHLVPIWECHSQLVGSDIPLYKRFQEANQWIGDYLVFYPISQRGYLRKIGSNQWFTFFRKCREFILDRRFGDAIEFILKKFQERRIKKDPLTYQSGGRVVFNDSQLEFHPDSPEKKVLKKYNQKMNELGLVELGREDDSGLTI